MIRKNSRKSAFKAGMYLLETLTSGMYNDSLAIYREYIQNASDSIDIAKKTNKRTSKRIHIDLDPFEKTITIYDRGKGIPSNFAEKTLSSVGLSSKTNYKLRGFRGVGRLGGLAFCDFATFRTKVKGENIESIQEWDCNKLRQLLSGSAKRNFSLKQLFDKATVFYQENSKKRTGSYFEVKLHGVQSFRNHIMDIKKVYDYLSVTAPVPFNPDELSFADEINSYLSKNLRDYNQYDILLNGEAVFKPYCDKVKLTSRGHDVIEGIKTFDIKVNDTSVAYGWYGDRRDFLGAITKGELASGMRVRDGNIQIGDSHLIDGCFRESRFNSYIVGEIHVDCDELVPNSRRDDFIDNETKGLFYNAIEREIGLPISKKIRLSSRLKSKRNISPTENNETNNNLSRKSGNYKNDKDTSSELNIKLDQKKQTHLLEIIEKECKDCPALQKIRGKVPGYIR